jgi:hypothetical protein
VEQIDLAMLASPVRPMRSTAAASALTDAR